MVCLSVCLPACLPACLSVIADIQQTSLSYVITATAEHRLFACPFGEQFVALNLNSQAQSVRPQWYHCYSCIILLLYSLCTILSYM